MTTKLLHASKNDLIEAARLLNASEIVAFPTETVYGLGAKIFDPVAIQKIYSVKGRPADNPIIAHVSDMSQVHQITSQLPSLFTTLANHFFPGPLTLVVPKHEDVPEIVSAGLPTVALRMPRHPTALALIAEVGIPLVAPSANLSGHPSPTSAQHVFDDLHGKIAAIIDGGPCDVGIESTVLDLTTDPPTILRHGIISQNEIEHIIHKQVHTLTTVKNIQVNSPGLRYSHYKPMAHIVVISALSQMPDTTDRTLVLTNEKISLKNGSMRPLDAQSLFANFRWADSHNIETIIIVANQDIQDQSGLLDRITRAAAL